MKHVSDICFLFVVLHACLMPLPSIGQAPADIPVELNISTEGLDNKRISMASEDSWENFSYRMESFPYSHYFSSGTLFVVVSFDGCRELNRWQDILEFSRANNMKFTFFISAAYLIAEQDRQLYYDPVNPVKEGYSRIGFGGTRGDVEKRKSCVLEAIKLGNDVESHLCGHFDAREWETQDWHVEFEEFNEICSFLPAPARHIRFPLLSMNKYVYPVIAEFGFNSVISVDEDEFDKFNRVTVPLPGGNNRSFLEFPMPWVKEGKSKVLLMDYNFFVHDKRNKVSAGTIEQKLVDTYIREADRCYFENRPLFISHHFSVKDSNDSYWKAMKKVLLTLGLKYPVKFITVTELYDICSFPRGGN